MRLHKEAPLSDLRVIIFKAPDNRCSLFMTSPEVLFHWDNFSTLTVCSLYISFNVSKRIHQQNIPLIKPIGLLLVFIHSIGMPKSYN